MNIDDYINNLQSDIDIQLSQFGLNGGQQDTASESEKKFRPECGTQVEADAKSAMAYCLIDEGKYWEAQSLIYEAGDTLYDLQDGSELLQGIYASMLTVCARLYVAVHRIDVAQEAINGSLSIFDRLPAGCTGATDEQREEATLLATEISKQR